MERRGRWQAVVLVGALANLSACSGSGNATGPAPIRAIAVYAGDNQTARINSAVPTPPAIIVRDASSNPVAGIAVTFSVASGGGSVAGPVQTTDASGIARVNGWTLGASAGPNALSASASGVQGSPVQFTATGRLPYWTVMVYMAADNNLSVYGIMNIDAMEAAGFNPDVQVLVQAEFNPTELAQYGCTPQTCFNRPNYNTFRYVFTGAGTPTLGPDGPTIDIGNVDMTNPATLKQFVQWGEQTAPAQHYVLVLWNHGGGFTGLLADETSNPGHSMSLPELHTALTGLPSIDVVDFDMCLMASYETLVELQGLAQTAVFSEEVIPGSGDPYQTILAAMQGNPTADPKTVAKIWADQYGAFYAVTPNDKASTTISAYDLSQFATYDQAVGSVATQLQTNINTYAPTILGLLATTQKYSIPVLTDAGAFLDSLQQHVSDANLKAAIGVVLSTSAGSFRLANHARNGTAGALGQPPHDVSRSTGLQIVLPRGAGDDQLYASGPQSLATYQAEFAGKPWTNFLAAWAASLGTFAVTDQDTNRLEVYLGWDTAAVTHQADVDLWVLEPNGNVYIPHLGTVTPNGVMTGDSYEMHTWFEGYYSNRFIQKGQYKFYGNLWLDQQNLALVFQVYYRYSQGLPFQLLYPQPLPQFSLQNSWLNDPSVTWAKVDSNKYTDLRPTAFVTFPSPPAPALPASAPKALVASSDASPSWATGAAPEPTAPTRAQLSVMRRWATARRATGLAQRRGPRLRGSPSGPLPVELR